MNPGSSASPSSQSPIPSTVFSLIHDLHSTITRVIDTSLTWEQLNSPPINYTLIRPIIARLAPKKYEPKLGNSSGISTTGELLSVPRAQDGGELGGERRVKGSGVSLGGVLYALIANRMQFMTLSSRDMSYVPLQTTRAAFCELLAMKILRTFPHPEDEAQLVSELVHGYCAFDGASDHVWSSMGDDWKAVEETRSSALELAIVSKAKQFCSLPLIQHLVNKIFLGYLIYSPRAPNSLIADSYISERTRMRRRASHSSVHRPAVSKAVVEEEDMAEVYLFDPFEAGWLDHQRLRVPKWRKWLEFTSFAILMVLFVLTLSFKNSEHLNGIEIAYIIFTFGFMLDEFATSKEHGWTVYAANAWNTFDLLYIVIFIIYFFLRIIGLVSHSPSTSDLAFDILACAACVLFPRLAFFLIEGNVVLLALRAMLSRYLGFMGLVIVAFSGICFCLWTLGRGTWTVRQIVWLMLQIWFGSSYLGFSSSESFHPIFGPIILISYAALCNTLLITILISILSNQFADINANAQEEHLFQKVVKTVEGVKSDAVFCYLPPVNIVAFAIFHPLSWVCSPRTLHRINVFSIRLTSFPLLIAISAYERYQFRSKRQIYLGRENMQPLSFFDSILGGGFEMLISSVFETGPLPNIALEIRTPPKASSVAGTTSDAESEEEPNQRDTSDSPLANIFGRAEAVPRSVKRKEKMKMRKEVERIKDEVREVRESQLRMEEMLAKVLAGIGK